MKDCSDVLIQTLAIGDDLRCSAINGSVDLEYAFSLHVGDEVISKGEYSKLPTEVFKLNYDRQKKHEVICYIKQSNGKTRAISHEVERLEIDMQPHLRFNKNGVQCSILMDEKHAMYAFYLYIDGEVVKKTGYSRQNSFFFDLDNQSSFQEIKATYFLRDEFGNIYSDEIVYNSYKPENNADKIRNEFYFFLSKDKSKIYKIVDLGQSGLTEILKEPGHFQNYRLIMDGEIFSEKLSPHVVKGFEVEPEGSYKSKFIEGYRLDLVYDLLVNYKSLDFPSRGERRKIRNQAKRLLDILIEESDKNALNGDWALHNLIYSRDEDKIYNVDLEGFIRYNPLPSWCGIDKIHVWFEELIKALDRI